MRFSEKVVLLIVSMYCVLHILILVQLIPYHIVWGGKIESIKTIYFLEGVALVVMLFLGFIIAMKNKIIQPIFKHKTIKRILFVFAVFFILNTIGNLLAETIIEKMQAIIALFLAITLFKSSKEMEVL